ncbi:MAG: hypothetical protein LBK60_05695 [Verrucomicrobiales bacterium]|jgi:hypothetical protein|nr:hypothetical protein [Verrucomicrobiales bacterium]
MKIKILTVTAAVTLGALSLPTPARAQSYYTPVGDFTVEGLYLPYAPQGAFSVYQGLVYSWNAVYYGNPVGIYTIYDLNTRSLSFEAPGTALDGNGFGDPFGRYDPVTGIFYIGTYTDNGTSGLWRYNDDGTYTKLGAFGSLYGADFFEGRVYASGLNQIWNGTTGQDNQIAIYDLTGGGQHDVIIQNSGNSATVAVDRLGNVYYANYNGQINGATATGLYMWTAEQIESVRADLGNGTAGGGIDDLFLTYDDALFLTALPGGANGITADDGGNIFISTNAGVAGILMWNPDLGYATEDDPDHYQLIANMTSKYGWAGFLDTEGDVLNGGILYAGSAMMGEDFYIFTHLIPEPSIWATLLLGGVMLLLALLLHFRREPKPAKPQTWAFADFLVLKLNPVRSFDSAQDDDGGRLPSKNYLPVTPTPPRHSERSVAKSRNRFAPPSAIILLTLLTLTATLSAQPIEIPEPPNPATGPYGGGVGAYPANWFNAPVPGFIGPAGDGKAPYLYSGNYLNPAFVGWATSVIEYKPANGVAQNWQVPTRALGPVTGDVMDIVTLGELWLPYDVTINGLDLPAPEKDDPPPYVNRTDPNYKPYTGNPADQTDGWSFVGYDQPGYITLSFASPIVNGDGADLVVFENGFVSNYNIPGTGSIEGGVFAELAYVEVSTDGIHFARFPSVSLTADPVNRYGTIDPSNVYNLAGASCNAYGESWGTPFNLDDLLTDPDALSLIEDGYLNLDNIVYIKIIDIPGCGYYTDSLGNPIYDAWYTYGSGGFDLEAIGVLHNRESEYGELTATALSQSLTMTAQPIPEPSTWALLAGSLALLIILSGTLKARAPLNEAPKTPVILSEAPKMHVILSGAKRSRRTGLVNSSGLTAIKRMNGTKPVLRLRASSAPLRTTSAREKA